MKLLHTIARELFGLFVDDGLLAVAVLVWLGIVKWVVYSYPSVAAYGGVALFAGLALILAESALRYARRRR